MSEAVRAVPFFGLDRQFSCHAEALTAIARRSWATGQVMQGPEVQQFENKLARLTGRKHAVAVGSCSDALAFCLTACGIGAGAEVIMTSFSFVASVNAVLRVGATPVFVDVCPGSHLMDIEQIDRCLGPKTRAVLGVHLFGRTLPIAALERYCRQRNMLLIEDAAQALGCLSAERKGGSMGQASGISFDPTKVVGSYSNGGAVLTDDEELAQRARLYRQHGRNARTREFEVCGHNSQLPSHLAAMLDYKLDFLAAWERERQRVAEVYHRQLGDCPCLQLPEIPALGGHAFHKYVVRAARRDELATHLQKKGVATTIHYPYLLPDLPFVGVAQVGKSPFPIAARIASEVLSLPIFPELSTDEVLYVCACVKEFYLANA